MCFNTVNFALLVFKMSGTLKYKIGAQILFSKSCSGEMNVFSCTLILAVSLVQSIVFID